MTANHARVLHEHVADLTRCAPILREHGLTVVADEVEKAVGELAPVISALARPDDDWHLRGYTYASKQATKCAGCGEHRHTPLRIDAMGGYVCLTCIDRKLGGLLGEFGYESRETMDAVERAARAMARHAGWEGWDAAKSSASTLSGNDPDDEREHYRDLARVALHFGAPAN